jgi:hypothetical protein
LFLEIKNISEYGNAYLERTRNHLRRELSTIKKIPITKDLNPPLISARAMDALSALKVILGSFKEGKLEGLNVNEITSCIYDVTETKKKDKVVRKVEIKKELSDAGWIVAPIKTVLECGVYECELKINLGLDIPTRNALKKMESENTKVYVLTWPVGIDVFKYATIINSGDDWGIWAGYYSNTVFVPPEKWLTETVEEVKE